MIYTMDMFARHIDDAGGVDERNIRLLHTLAGPERIPALSTKTLGMGSRRGAVSLSKLMPFPCKAGVLYHESFPDSPPESIPDHLAVDSFNTDKVPLKVLLYRYLPPIANAFEAFMISIAPQWYLIFKDPERAPTDEEYQPVTIYAPTIPSCPARPFRLSANSFFDRKFCHDAFGVNPEILAGRVRGLVEDVRLDDRGIWVIGSTQPLENEANFELAARIVSAAKPLPCPPYGPGRPSVPIPSDAKGLPIPGYLQAVLGIAKVLDGFPFESLIPRDRMDFSLESLKAVDSYLAYVHPRREEISSLEKTNLIFGLGAYLGEVIIRASHGRAIWSTYDEAVSADPLLAVMPSNPFTAQGISWPHEPGSYFLVMNKIGGMLHKGPTHSLHHLAAVELKSNGA